MSNVSFKYRENVLENLADGFLEALEVDFENISSTALRDAKVAESPSIQLASLNDWAGLERSLPKSPSFPEVPASEHNFPRPSSKQKRTVNREGERGGTGGAAARHVIVDKDSNSIVKEISERRAKSKKSEATLPIGWTYKKGWANRPRASSIDNDKLTSDIMVRARKLQMKRDEAKRNNLMGKGKGANFSHPENTRLRPKGFGSADLNRLKLVHVDVSAGRTPGPRYVVDPQPTRLELRKQRKGKIILPNSSIATGRSKTMGMKLDALAGSTMSLSIDKAPSLESFERLGASESIDMLEKRGEKTLSSSIHGPRLDTSGRTDYGGIYYDSMQAQGPGPARYDINESFLKTSAVIRTERPVFSPANSRPSSPEVPSSLPGSKEGRRKRVK